MESGRDKILSWLLEEGLEVRVEPVPPGVPVEWVVLVQIPGVVKVNVAIQQPRGRVDVIVVSLGVMIGPEHRELITRLGREDRLILASGILRDLIMVCSDCAIAVQPSLEDPQFINVTKLVYASSLSRESLMSVLRLMANMFTLIVTDINSSLAAKGLYRRPSEGMVM
ncbi:MAG: DUF2299 family protein [Acidilobaceae archaeon]